MGKHIANDLPLTESNVVEHLLGIIGPPRMWSEKEASTVLNKVNSYLADVTRRLYGNEWPKQP